jgi:deazaflavin-dependent oxidoreductase (nitroreductase family)
MADENTIRAEPVAQPAPPTAARATTLSRQAAVNRVIRGLLRTPLLCRLVGTRLMTIYVVGRKSGRHFSVPVAYAHHDGCLVVGTPFGWARNLHTGQLVEVRLKGKRRTADVQVITDERGVVENFGAIARANHQFAKFNKISLDESGEPDPTDLRLAWSAGARALRFTPHRR